MDTHPASAPVAAVTPPAPSDPLVSFYIGDAHTAVLQALAVCDEELRDPNNALVVGTRVLMRARDLRDAAARLAQLIESAAGNS